jgi:ABC-type transport system involved in Fe-S cluster assembly fused permease/ATPase subunit
MLNVRQLYGPLNNLGYIYRSINTNLVDTERLIKLLEEPKDVNDKEGAPDLVIKHGGEIEFGVCLTSLTAHRRCSEAGLQIMFHSPTTAEPRRCPE